MNEVNLNKYTSNSSKGYVLEINLEYPKELHEIHNDYPLAPDEIEIEREMLSEYHMKIEQSVKQSVPKFFDKEKYVIHYEDLPLYLRLGLKLKKYIAC